MSCSIIRLPARASSILHDTHEIFAIDRDCPPGGARSTQARLRSGILFAEFNRSTPGYLKNGGGQTTRRVEGRSQNQADAYPDRVKSLLKQLNDFAYEMAASKYLEEIGQARSSQIPVYWGDNPVRR